MKRLLCTLLAILSLLTITSCRGETSPPYILPVSTTRNHIRIAIDPRVELVAIVQYLSSYRKLVTTADFSYRADVDRHFGQYRDHEAVSIYEEMVETGFRFSSPANFALSLTTGLYLDESVRLSDHVLWGGGGKEQLERFAQALRDFSLKSKFSEFYADHEEYYRDNIYRVVDLLGDWDYVGELQGYYGMDYRSFSIIPVPLYGGGGGFGPHVEREGSVDAYCVLVPFDEEIQGDIPIYGTKSIFKLLLRHEFSHCFVNRVTDMYYDEAMKYQHLLNPIQEEMDALDYGFWLTCLNEHLVRAVTTRLAFADSPAEGRKALARELKEGFAYTDILVEALAEYEKNKDEFNFISFYPQLLEALNSTP